MKNDHVHCRNVDKCTSLKIEVYIDEVVYSMESHSSRMLAARSFPLPNMVVLRLCALLAIFATYHLNV